MGCISVLFGNEMHSGKDTGKTKIEYYTLGWKQYGNYFAEGISY